MLHKLEALPPLYPCTPPLVTRLFVHHETSWSQRPQTSRPGGFASREGADCSVERFRCPLLATATFACNYQPCSKRVLWPWHMSISCFHFLACQPVSAEDFSPTNMAMNQEVDPPTKMANRGLGGRSCRYVVMSSFHRDADHNLSGCSFARFRPTPHHIFSETLKRHSLV